MKASELGDFWIQSFINKITQSFKEAESSYEKIKNKDGDYGKSINRLVNFYDYVLTCIQKRKENINISKVNETVNMPPQLSNQYFQVKRQLADKQGKKDELMKQVNQVNSEMTILNKNIIALEAKAAEMIGQEVKEQPIQQPQQQPQQPQEQTQQQPQETTESMAEKFYPSLDEAEEEERFTGKLMPHPKDPDYLMHKGRVIGKVKQPSWHEGHAEYRDLTDVQKRHYDEIDDKILKLEREQDGIDVTIIVLKEDIRDIKSRATEREMESEEWSAEVQEKWGWNVFDAVNAGTSKSELEKMGVPKRDAQDLLEMWDYYYAGGLGEIEQEIGDLKKEIEKLQKQSGKLDDQVTNLKNKQDDIGRKKVDPKFVYDPEGFEPIRESEYEEAWEDEGYEESEEDEPGDEWLFHVRLYPEAEEPVLVKIFKPSDDENWEMTVLEGDAAALEEMTFTDDYDKIEIISYLADLYDEVEEIDNLEAWEEIDDKSEIDKKFYN